MLKQTLSIALGTMFICGSTLAAIDCHGKSALMCIDVYANSSNHYIQIETDYFKTPPFCAEANLLEHLSLDNNDLEGAITFNVLNLGTNHIKFSQCDNRYCRHPISIGEYAFDLKLNNDTGAYTVTPPRYEFHIENYGETCHFPFSYKKFF